MSLPAIITLTVASIVPLFWLWMLLKGIISRKIKLPCFLLLYYFTSLIFFLIKIIINDPSDDGITIGVAGCLILLCSMVSYRLWRAGKIGIWETVKILEYIEYMFSPDGFEKRILEGPSKGREVGLLILKLFGKKNAPNFMSICMFSVMSALNIYTAFYLKEGSVQKFNREFNSSDLEIIFNDTTVKWTNPKGVKVTLTLNSDGSARLLAESEQQKIKRKGQWWTKASNIHCVKWIDKKKNICRPIGLIKNEEEALSTNARGMTWTITKD